jgi:hypothetical protein
MFEKQNHLGTSGVGYDMISGPDQTIFDFQYSTSGKFRIYMMVFLTDDDNLTLTGVKLKQLAQMFLQTIYIGTLI